MPQDGEMQLSNDSDAM